MRCFKIVDATGRTTVIYASCRKDAVERYIELTGCSIEWVKKHCTIRNVAAAKTPDSTERE